jgi:hypothetical protein
VKRSFYELRRSSFHDSFSSDVAAYKLFKIASILADTIAMVETKFPRFHPRSRAELIPDFSSDLTVFTK